MARSTSLRADNNNFAVDGSTKDKSSSRSSLALTSSSSSSSSLLSEWESTCQTPRQIALERLRWEEEADGRGGGQGLAPAAVSLLRGATDSWIRSVERAVRALERRDLEYGDDAGDVDTPSVEGLLVAAEDEKKSEYETSSLDHDIARGCGCDVGGARGAQETTGEAEPGQGGHPRDAAARDGASGATSTSTSIAGTSETLFLVRVLRLHLAWSRRDPVLAEELGLEGGHALLSRIVRFEMPPPPLPSSDAVIPESDQDAFDEVKDLACEIAASCGASFPVKYSPLTDQERRRRLPMVFEVDSALAWSDEGVRAIEPVRVLINQVPARQSAQEDVGFVMWPSAVVLAGWIVANPKRFQDRTVLELGAGCGLTGLVAAAVVRASSTAESSESGVATDGRGVALPAPSPPPPSVVQTDCNDVVLQNLARNIRLNDMEDVASAAKLDFYQQGGDRTSNSKSSTSSPVGWIDGASGGVRDPVDVVIAADVICRPSDAVAVARSIRDCLKPDGYAAVVCADAVHRFGVEVFTAACLEVGMNVSSTNVADMYGGNMLSPGAGLEDTSGYVAEMTFTLFEVTKGPHSPSCT